MLKKLLVIVPLLMLTACESYTASRYVPASTNQATLKSLPTSKKFSVADFQVETPESMSVSCRLAGPIQVAGAGKHEEYIQKALIDELQTSGLYSEGSSRTLGAMLKQVHVSTISPASWSISGDFYLNDKLVKQVETKFPYKTSYSAHGACNNAAENFPYAVEEFIGAFIKSPEFKKAAR